MGNTVDAFLDMLEVAAGAYLIYCAISMKYSGKISSGLVSRSLDLDKAPDKAAYIRSMFLPDIILGIILILCGCMTTFLPKIGITVTDTLSNIVLGCALALCILYGFFAMKMQKKYLES